MAVSGERIRQLRKEAGLTQEALGKKLGVIKQTVSSWENGISEPNSEILSNMASIFEIPIGYLYGDASTGIDYKNYQMDTPQFAFEFKMKLRDLLTEKKISKDIFAGMLNFSKEEVDAYLYGNQIPSIEDLIKIAGVEAVNFSVSMEEKSFR